MPLPFLAVAAVGVGLTGIFKGGKAISNNSKANDLIESAEWTYNDAKDTLEYQKNSTVSMLDKLGETMLNSWSNDIGEFIPLFNSFKKVQVEKKGNINLKLKDKISSPRVMKNMQVASLKATEVLGTGVSALGAGALAGIASYGGAMMFASASTGTAIAFLQSSLTLVLPMCRLRMIIRKNMTGCFAAVSGASCSWNMSLRETAALESRI